jgi:phosphoribosylaminoimidazolecarboxamide formyltransferase/IMP cyclohydrolase
MLRSAAKNFDSVTVITDVEDYATVKIEMEQNGDTYIETRKNWQEKYSTLLLLMMQRFQECF